MPAMNGSRLGRTPLYQSTQYIARPQLVRLGPKMRTFTPRWSDYPTDPTDHFVSGIHNFGYTAEGIYGERLLEYSQSPYV